jgi:ABC-type branched-subunit amino acid transport system ATPase component/ABC-type branched-subunit amino acid transport system permease subunit
MLEIGSVQITPALLALGSIQGMTFGVLAVGIVLVYRSDRIVNFAHGEIGAFGAAVCGALVFRWHIPYWVAFAAGLIAASGAGAVTEIAVIRRLRNAPKIMSLVGTLGVAQFLLFFSAAIYGRPQYGSTFPQPSGMPEFNIGVLRVTRAYSAMLILGPLVVAALVLFLRRSNYGLALRATAASSENASLAGVPVGRMSTLSWVIAGAVAGSTIIFILPTSGFVPAETLGPAILLRALAPAVMARMRSLPIALAAGIGVGLVDQILVYNYPTSGFTEVVLLGVIVVALLFQARGSVRERERQDWGVLQPWRSLSPALRDVWAIRNLGTIAGVATLAVAVVLSFVVSNATAVTLVAIVAFGLIGLSVGVVTGLGGQLSLGQFAIAGVGATATYAVASRTGNFPLALVAAAIAAGAVSVVIGLPALRVRGLLLGVVTLSFALAAQRWFFGQSWALGVGVRPGRPGFGSFVMDTTKRYYVWTLLVLTVALWIARSVWRGGIGLRLRAARDNEDAIRSFAISATAVKLQGFLIAGVLAGLGGAVYGPLLSRISPRTFDVVTSIHVVALTVLGGIGILIGPLLGALYIVGLPRFLPFDNAAFAATSLGWLALILYAPGGIAQLAAAPRRLIIGWIAKRADVRDTGAVDPGDVDTGATALVHIELAPAGTRRTPAAPADVALAVSNLTKRYGGVVAVDDVGFAVSRGEILGLIGPNGAGKTTVFETISGFSAPDSGTVALYGTDVTHLPPERRARLGLIRSFQDATLFPTLTVLECVTLALEREQPTRIALSAIGVQGAERRKRERARELLDALGLSVHETKQIRELSTGTSRITELACLVALEPGVLLLDEPSSGIAQRESEALGEMLLRLQAHLDVTLLVIEHDIPLLLGISTRMIAMDSGKLIAHGRPPDVVKDALVVESYLGRNTTAIDRSGTARPRRARAVTRS